MMPADTKCIGLATTCFGHIILLPAYFQLDKSMDLLIAGIHHVVHMAIILLLTVACRIYAMQTMDLIFKM